MSIPASKPNVEKNKTSYTSELLFSFIEGTPQHATLVAKYYSDASNNYCITEDMLVLTNIWDTRKVSAFQLLIDIINFSASIYMCILTSSYTILSRGMLVGRLQSAIN